MRRAIILLCCVLLCAPATDAASQQQTQRSRGGSIAERYERARRALEEERAAESKTEAEHARLAREAEELRTHLIANAARVQSLEAELSATETELGRLQSQARTLEEGFARDRDKVGHLLAVLQRLDADEPPALALRPDDSLAAARGTMLLGAMLPPIYERAAVLARRLQSLRATQAALQKKRVEARATTKALKEARVELASLLERRSGEAAVAEARLVELRELIAQVARKTGDLKSLIDRIARLRAQNTASQAMTVVGADSIGSATIRKGALRRPVVGRMIRGGPDAPGPTTAQGAEISGLWFETTGGAQAVAPADSEVVFAGPYQKFGQVLILEIAGGYDLLLAGLGRVNVRIGDSVLAGEPVGILPEGTQAHLYMELRRGGETVNPTPWLAAELRKAKGS